MKKYLSSSKIINWDHPSILKLAKELTESCYSEEEIVDSCYNFVRDKIKHSNDYQINPITIKASDVLKYETGFCYSKSHLLAALLRANKIPTGMCYQRLTVENDKPPFCIHGLNAVFMKKFGWYRIDARGNKPGVSAAFCPPHEQLAFPIAVEGECDLQGIWPEPLDMVVKVLKKFDTYIEVQNNLPDIEILRG